MTFLQLTHIPMGQYGRHFAEYIFRSTFMNAFFLYFDKNFTDVLLRSNWQQPNIGLDNGLAANMRQAIICTNADRIHWRIYAALWGDELKSVTDTHTFWDYSAYAPSQWETVLHCTPTLIGWAHAQNDPWYLCIFRPLKQQSALCLEFMYMNVLILAWEINENSHGTFKFFCRKPVVNSTLENRFKWNLNKNSTILNQKNAFEYVVSKMMSILFRLPRIEVTWYHLTNELWALTSSWWCEGHD